MIPNPDPNIMTCGIDCRGRKTPKLFDRFETDVHGDRATWAIIEIVAYAKPQIAEWGVVATHHITARRVLSDT